MIDVKRKVMQGRKQEFPWSAPTWPESLDRPAPDRGTGVDYCTAWSRRYPARLFRAILLDNVTRPLTHVLASPQVRGSEVLELVDPPAIFVVNHSSHVDTPLLLSVLPPRIRHRTVVAAAADHFFDRRWKSHLWAFALAAIPIERHRPSRRSAEVASELLERGWNLVIYPEGGRSPDGWLQPFRGGAAYLATRTGRPVVPVHLEGTFDVLPRGAKRLRRSSTTVTFGSPLTPNGEDARHMASRIEMALGVLADESTSDFWTARRRAAEGSTPSPRGPDVSPWRRAWELPPPRHEHDGDVTRWAVTGETAARWRARIGVRARSG